MHPPPHVPPLTRLEQHMHGKGCHLEVIAVKMRRLSRRLPANRNFRSCASPVSMLHAAAGAACSCAAILVYLTSQLLLEIGLGVRAVHRFDKRMAVVLNQV
jgi:hypothetical protein